MKLLLLSLLFIGCGKVSVSDSHHEVSGEATVRVVVGVDVKVCESLPEAERPDCVRTLIEMATAMAEKDEDEDEGLAGFY